MKEIIESAFEDRVRLTPESTNNEINEAVAEAINLLDSGKARVAEQNSIYYEDDHDGYDYKMGLFNLRTFKFTGKTKEIIVQQHVAGTYESNLKTMKIKFHGLPFEITSASVNNENVSLESIGYDKESNTIILQENFTDLHLISE